MPNEIGRYRAAYCVDDEGIPEAFMLQDIAGDYVSYQDYVDHMTAQAQRIAELEERNCAIAGVCVLLPKLQAAEATLSRIDAAYNRLRAIARPCDDCARKANGSICEACWVTGAEKKFWKPANKG
jgi:hypothetical protein